MATNNSTRPEQPRVAYLIVRISRALEAYEAGDLTGALAALDGLHADPLPDRPEWYEKLADYLTADHSEDLAVWVDGTVQLIDHNVTWRNDDEAPIARVQCPGIGNLDSTYFTEDFVTRREDGEYVEIATGRVVGYLENVIRECCQDGDMTGYMDDLTRELQIAAELERRAASAQHGVPVPAAALDWIGLAKDRIRREQGANILGAVTPVRLALRSALACLGAEG